MNELNVDPEQLREFANDVADKLKNDFRGRIDKIRTLMGDDNFTLGSNRDAGEQFAVADYSGRGVGFAMGSSIYEGLAWLERMETGLEALSLASAVFQEQLVTGDVLNAEDLQATTDTPPGDSDGSSGGGGNDRFVI